MNQQLSMPRQQEVHLQDYLNVVLRQKKTFALVFLAVLIMVTLYTFLAPPTYESVATLFVKDDQGKVGQMGDLLLNSPAAVDSEIEILKSRSNAEKVVSQLHLDWKIDDRSGAASAKLLEFSSTLEKPVYRVTLLGNGAYAVKDDDGRDVGTGSSGVLLRAKGLSLLMQDVKGEKGASFRLTLLPFNETVKDLRKKIKAVEVAKKTNVIAITYRNHDPQLARDVVNTLVQAYLQKGVAIKAEEATRTVGFVSEQLKGVKAELEGAEKNLAAYKSSTGVVQLDAEAQDLIQTLSDAEKQRAEVALKRKQLEFALQSLKNARAKGSVYSPAVIGEDPVLASMASRLSEAEVQKKALLSDSTENHPSVKVVQNQIDELQKKIQATYETSLRNTVKQEEGVLQEISRRDAQLKRLPVAERDLARLMRLSKVNSDIYTFLLQKHEEARIAQASTINNISIVDPAIVDDKPVSPKKALNLLLAVVVGAMLGGGVCFFREYMDDTLKGPEDVKRHLSLPILSSIPYIAEKNGDQALVSHHSPQSLASEAFRTLRTALHFCTGKDQKNVFLVTSALPGEGKSTVACNLAITLAQGGGKVLIVDCDLRRSTLHQKFGLPKDQGLTELLVGDLSVDAGVQETSVKGLHLIKSGILPPNPSEMLGSMAMTRLVEQMRDRYSHIVLDAPPVLAVSDATVLTRLADLVLVVLEPGRVPVKAAQRTKETLMAAVTPIAGFVVSDKSDKGASYGYGGGYGYGYYYGSGEQETGKSWLNKIWQKK